MSFRESVIAGLAAQQTNVLFAESGAGGDIA